MRFSEVTKSFGEVHALQGISFEVPEHSIFGLLGPNGAGKTTLIRIITKIFAADSGSIYFRGENMRRQRYADIGYMPEEKGMYKKMKVGEHLVYLGRLKGLQKSKAKERVLYWFERLEIKDWWNKKVGDLSKGMQQKAQFIASVLHDPTLLILDEPFSGLDPVNAELIKNEIYALNEKGVTILFSTHRMEQVEEICRNIALINKGEVILDGNLREIRNRFRESRYSIVTSPAKQLQSCAYFDVLESREDAQILHLHAGVSRNSMLEYCIQQGLEILSFHEILPSLNDIFIRLVKEPVHA